MEFTEYLDEADAELTPFGVLFVTLGDDELAIKCMEALEKYGNQLDVGNNQVPAIVFFKDGVVFGAVDLWNGEEEVM